MHLQVVLYSNSFNFFYSYSRLTKLNATSKDVQQNYSSIPVFSTMFDNLKAKYLPLSLSNWQLSREFSTRTETAACSNLKKFVLSNAVNDVISFDQMSPLGGQLTIKASKLYILPRDIHLIRTISTRTYAVTSNLTYTKQVLSRNFFSP